MRIVGRREDFGEGGVDPVHHFGVRAVVAVEAQGFELDRADANVTRLQEKADVGLAEAIDGLHRIADNEQGAPVALLPAGGEPLQQRDLRGAGVLELIDQQMADAVIELELEIGRLGFITECGQRALCDFDEVDFALLLEHGPQLRDGELEQAREDADDARLFGIEPGLGQQLDARQRFRRARRLREDVDAGGKRFLDGLGLLLGGQAHVFVEALAQGAGVGEQQSGEAAPGGKVGKQFVIPRGFPSVIASGAKQSRCGV